jgi:hypothetical protein
MIKNKYTLCLTAGLIFFVLTASCKSGPPAAKKDKAEFELKKTSMSLLLYPEQISGSPRMNFNLALLDVSGPGETANFFTALLYEGQKPDEYRDILIQGYRDTYMAMREFAEDGAETNAADWYYTEEMNTRALSDRGIIIGRELEYYTGGAHGASQKIYYVVDLKKMKPLYWEEFFADPESLELYGSVLEGLRIHAGLEKDARLTSGFFFEEEPEMTPNFFLTPDGMGFRWNPYEIAPYSAGPVEIVIPWGKIRNLLSSEGLELLKDFGIKV